MTVEDCAPSVNWFPRRQDRRPASVYVTVQIVNPIVDLDSQVLGLIPFHQAARGLGSEHGKPECAAITPTRSGGAACGARRRRQGATGSLGGETIAQPCPSRRSTRRACKRRLRNERQTLERRRLAEVSGGQNHPWTRPRRDAQARRYRAKMAAHARLHQGLLRRP